MKMLLREFLHYTLWCRAANSNPRNNLVTLGLYISVTLPPRHLVLVNKLCQGWISSSLLSSAFCGADLHAVSFKSCNSDGLKSASMKITCGLKVRRQNDKEHCIQYYCCLDGTERKDGKILLQPTAEIRQQLGKSAARKGGTIHFRLGLHL